MNEHYDFTFPPADLIAELVPLYFLHYNTYCPLLHRPTFVQGIKDGLHLRDPGFGSVVMMVCALGARFSEDPRVLLEEEAASQRESGKSDSEKTWHSAGWMWFIQVQRSRLAMSFLPPNLYDLQVCYVRSFIISHNVVILTSLWAQLAAIYGWGTPTPGMPWNSAGLGLRMAQSMGVHRKKAYGPVPTVEEELRKRAFW